MTDNALKSCHNGATNRWLTWVLGNNGLATEKGQVLNYGILLVIIQLRIIDSRLSEDLQGLRNGLVSCVPHTTDGDIKFADLPRVDSSHRAMINLNIVQGHRTSHHCWLRYLKSGKQAGIPTTASISPVR